VPLTILGIDPGLANTGWGLIECEGSQYRCRAYGCISTSPKDPLPARLRKIHDSIADLIHEESPDECAVENVYFSTNVKTAFATGQARGVAILATSSVGLKIGEYGPSEIKHAVTGHGGAEKSQIAYMVRTILHLDHEPSPDHAADALAAAICHANGRRVGSIIAKEGVRR